MATANPERNFQTFLETSVCSELYGEYSDVLNSPELPVYHAQEKLNSNHKHGVVGGDELEKEWRRVFRL